MRPIILSGFLIYALCPNAGMAITDAQWNRLSSPKAIAISIHPSGEQLQSPGYGYCYQTKDLAEARTCALSKCNSFSNGYPCVIAAENSALVFDNSLTEYRGNIMKSALASLKQKCRDYGITKDSDVDACVQLQIANQATGSSSNSAPPQSMRRNYNWDAIGQLGKDISSGKAWPSMPRSSSTPRYPAVNSCMKVSQYNAGGQKVCVYNCTNGSQTTRHVSQYAGCPLI